MTTISCFLTIKYELSNTFEKMPRSWEFAHNWHSLLPKKELHLGFFWHHCVNSSCEWHAWPLPPYNKLKLGHFPWFKLVCWALFLRLKALFIEPSLCDSGHCGRINISFSIGGWQLTPYPTCFATTFICILPFKKALTWAHFALKTPSS